MSCQIHHTKHHGDRTAQLKHKVSSLLISQKTTNLIATKNKSKLEQTDQNIQQSSSKLCQRHLNSWLRVPQFAPWKCSNIKNIKSLWSSKSLLDHPQTPTIYFSSPFKFPQFSSMSNSFLLDIFRICRMQKSCAILKCSLGKFHKS